MNENEFVIYNKKLFKKVAPKYKWLDLIASGCRKAFCKFTGHVKSLEILDVATGTGKQALAFAKKGAKVTGMDLSEDMLHYARLNDKSKMINFHCANGSKLPFDNNKFDIVTMSFALHCMTPDVRENTLREMKRVAKKGGRVMFIDYCKPKRGIGVLIYKSLTKFETPLYKKFLQTDFDITLEKVGLKKVKHEKLLFGTMQMISCELN
ncbi:class I SAM-dependent methyltransferase [Flavivirga jejuensis]|uniref:Methyltransferase domain-containing protein n=1 Tax=Flavivirga jejuensis TaxID=870487 RepID=A0ABT8WT29_9FLAO|nr:methyltransferase domain-containing protein [Flavivirga jejuensis]MDO5976351.1 methyltransferase domain-containing protein [Flavivirga jejuensis]